MPECHNCQHNGKRRRACLTCSGPKKTDLPGEGKAHEYNHGRRHVSMNAWEHYEKGENYEQGWVEKEAVMHSLLTPCSRPISGRQADREALVRFVLRLLSLDYRTRVLVLTRLRKPETPVPAIARRLGISPQAAHQRLQAAAGEWPAVRVLVGLKLKRTKNAPDRARGASPESAG